MGRLLIAACGVLVVSSMLVEASTVDRLTLKTVRRTVSADKRNYIFTVDFQAPAKPEAVWTKDSTKGTLTATGSLSYNTATKEGTAQLTVAKVDKPEYYDIVSVSVGDPSSHYFFLTWNHEGDEDLELDVNLPASAIAPSTNVAYTQGKSTDIVVTVQDDRGQNIQYCENAPMYLTGQYYDSAERDVVTDYMNFPFLKETERSRGEVTTTTYSFLTDQHTVNGAFRGSITCIVKNSQDSPVQYVDERFVLSVHEASNKGPFPDNFAKVDVPRGKNGQDPFGCLSDIDVCPARCSATANDLDTLVVFKIEDDGSRTQIESSSYVDFYQIHVTVDLKANGRDAVGQYVCQATRKGSERSVEDVYTVEEVTQKASVDSLRTKDLDKEKAVQVTCEGSGSNNLQVELAWQRRSHPLVVGERGVESYTPGTAPDGGSATATARITDTSGFTMIFCFAKNSASSALEYTWI